MHRTEGLNHVSNLFTETSPASIVDDDWLNAVQEEIINVLTQNGITPLTAATDTHDQLKDAINAMIAAAAAGMPSSTTARNLVMNGGMDVSQRNSSFVSPSTGDYTLDRWEWSFNGTGTVTISQSSTVPSGEVFGNSLKIDVTGADAALAAADYYMLSHFIEAQDLQRLQYGSSDAETLTLSFWVRSNLTGNFNVHLTAPDGSRNYPMGYTINAANTWEQKTITIDGDTAGTINNDTGIGIGVVFGLGMGTNYTSAGVLDAWGADANNYGTTTYNTNVLDNAVNELYITGVQLEVGSSASDFQIRSFDEELLLCQRYYEHTYSYGTPPGTVTDDNRFAEFITRNNATITMGHRYSVTKRAAPTITVYSSDSGASGFVRNAGDKAGSAISIADSGFEGVSIVGGMVDTATFHYTASADL